MGSGDAGVLDGGGGGCKAPPAAACSICLEVVIDNGDRSWAKLQCGHEFHLDCIGSAFNSKGAMQCPNCRKIEKGQWLYANGNRPLPEFSIEDWTQDEDLYDLSYSEMSLGVHWCPFTRVPPSFDDEEFSSTSQPGPYVTYFGPNQPSSSASSGDRTTFNNHWNGSSGVFPGYQNSMAQRSARNAFDIPRPGIHPFLLSHSSGRRFPSNRPSSPQAYFQQSVAQAPLPNGSGGNRGLGRTIQESENHHRDFLQGWEHAQHRSLFSSDSTWGSFGQRG